MTIKTPLLSDNKNWPREELEPYQKILPKTLLDKIQCVGDHRMLRSQNKVLFGLKDGLALANRTTGEFSYLDTKVFKPIVGCGCYFRPNQGNTNEFGKESIHVVTFFEDGDVRLWKLGYVAKKWSLRHVRKLGSKLPHLVAPVDLKYTSIKGDYSLIAYDPKQHQLYGVTSKKIEFWRKGDHKTLDTLHKSRQVSEKDAGDWIQARHLVNAMRRGGFF